MERQLSNLATAKGRHKTIKKVKLSETHKNQDAKMRRLVYKDVKMSLDVEEKTLMVVGQTGCGKTTMVDGIFNYLKDVDWDEDTRWRLTDLSYEDKNKQGDQTISQTEWITVYTVPKLSDKVPFRLNLIDTPGFGDTRGVKHDKELVRQMSSFFNHCEGNHGIMILDAVCFVVKAPDVRLSETQKYIFHSVLSIFGKDIAENMFLFATFGDTGTPKVYKALKKENITMADRFRFNNSVLYAGCTTPDGDDDEYEEDDAEDIQKAFWDMGIKSFDKFFTKLLTLQPKTTEMTQNVLKKRLQIQLMLDDLRTKIKNGVQQMQCLKKESSELAKHQKEMEENKDFSVTIESVHPTEESNKAGSNALYCKTCKATCHYPCVRFQILKYFCQAFTSKGVCSICHKRSQGKYSCNVAAHDFKDTHIEERVETRTETYDKIRARYMKAKGRRDSTVNVLDSIAKKYKQFKTEVEGLIDEAHQCYKQLNEIALRENPLLKPDFIDHLIQQEQSSQTFGFRERMQILCDVKQDALYMEKVKDGAKVLDSITNMEGMQQFVAMSRVYKPEPSKTVSSDKSRAQTKRK